MTSTVRNTREAQTTATTIASPDHQLSSVGHEVELGAERDQRLSLSERASEGGGLRKTGGGMALTAIHHPRDGLLTFSGLPAPTSAGDIMLGPQPAPPPLSASIPPWQARSG